MNQTQRLPSLSSFLNEIITLTRSKFSRIYQILLPAIVIFVAAIVVLMTSLGFGGFLTPEILASGHLTLSSLPILMRVFVLIIQIIVGLSALVSTTAAMVDMMDSSYAHQSIPTLYKTILTKFWPLVITYLGVALMVAGGTLLLIFPGLILSIVSMFALPLVIIEDLDLEKALARSNALTSGYKWGIFGRGLVFGIIIFVLFVIVGFLSGLLSHIHPIVGVVFGIASMVVVAPSVLTAVPVFYKHLTHLQEGEKKTIAVKEWIIIVFIILGVVYCILAHKKNNAPRKPRIDMATQVQVMNTLPPMTEATTVQQ